MLQEFKEFALRGYAENRLEQRIDEQAAVEICGVSADLAALDVECAAPRRF
jgi:hypothetical protein